MSAVRVSLVGHTYIAPVNREKLDELTRCPGVDLQVIVPTFWRERGMDRELRATPPDDPAYRWSPVPPLVQRNGTIFMLRSEPLWRALHEFGPHMIHLEQEPYTLVASQVALFARALRVPLLFFTWESIERKYPPPFSLLNKFVLATSREAIAGNRDACQVLKAKGFRKPVDVIPQLGVNPTRFAPPCRQGRRTGFVVGYIGRLVPEKGVHTLLEAVARLPERVTLLVVGAGPTREELMGLAAALGIRHRTRWVEAVPHEEVPLLLHDMDVLVLPSLTAGHWKEQFGHVLIEAMSSEVTVIGSDSGEIPAVIGDTGMVFPEGDATALASLLQELVDDEVQCRDLARRGRQRVLEQFTHEAIARRTFDAYIRVSAQPGISNSR